MKLKLRKRYIVGILLSLIVMYAGWKLSPVMSPKDETVVALPTKPITIDKKSGGSESFTMEIADEPVEMEIGLMYRKNMADDHGMLFYFGERPREVSFWMKNTYLPLDMLFVDETGKIVNIHHNATPKTLTPIPSKAPVTIVIEINGGLAEKRGIRPGDQVDLSQAIPGSKK